MLDWIWAIPFTIILLCGVYGGYKGYKASNQKDGSISHDKSEIYNGVGIMLLCLGVFKIAVSSGDVVALFLILIGGIVAVIYGIYHLKAREKERKIIVDLLKKAGVKLE